MSLLSDVWGDSWKSSNISTSTSTLKPFIGGTTNSPINISYNSKNISNYNSNSNSNNSQVNTNQLNNTQLIINNLLKENAILKNTVNKSNNVINYDDENLASSVLIGYFLLFIMDTFVDLGKQLT